MRLLPALAVAAATAASLAVAGPAAAQNTVRLYKVTAEGSGAFQARQLIQGLPGLPSEINSSLAYSWKVQLPSVAFTPSGQAVPVGPVGGAIKGAISGKGSQETVIRGLDGDGNVVVTRGVCTAAQQTQPVTGASVLPGPLGEEHGEPGGYLTVQPYGALALAATCEGEMMPPTSQVTAAVPAGATAQRFFLPRDATRMGKIIQLVHAGPDQKDKCELQMLDTCAFDWSGKLTFEFAGYLDKADEPAPIDEDDIPMPGPKPADPDDLDDIIIPLPGKAEVGNGGKSASLRLACAAACSGTVKAFPAARGAKASAAARRPLAAKRFSAPAGREVTVMLRFRGKARRAVRRAGAVKLVATAGGDRHVVVATR
jgi:hypothetical protein